MTDLEADEPYTLAGWAYGNPILPFNPEQTRPRLGCVPYHEWFVHEAGWHTPNDGGMYLDPPPHSPQTIPPEAVDLGANPTNYHFRIWDLHFWVNPGSELPRIAIFNKTDQGQKIPSTGVEPPEGMFFYPPMEP